MNAPQTSKEIVAAWITRAMGERCKTYSPTCYLCAAWKHFDATKWPTPEPPAARPEQTGVGDYCTVGPPHEQYQKFLLLFEDKSRGMCIYTDEGEARSRFAFAEGRGWNCHLFGLLRRASQPPTDGRLQYLEGLINSPEVEQFLRGTHLEAIHQVERWGEASDRGKRPADWFWLVGYLAGKALHAQVGGNTEKAKHHCISTAAALYNWHCAISGTDVRMAPGSSDVAKIVEAAFPGEVVPRDDLWNAHSNDSMRHMESADVIGGETDTPQREPTQCGYCTYEEADGSLVEQCEKCKAADGVQL